LRKAAKSLFFWPAYYYQPSKNRSCFSFSNKDAGTQACAVKAGEGRDIDKLTYFMYIL
jgi:hypothetical protein